MSDQFRPPERLPRCPEMNTLSSEQQRQVRALVRTYTPDLHDPAAVEVLLILLEFCRILHLVPGDVEQLFGERVLARLRRWDGLIVYPPGRQPRPARLRRVWVWRPDRLAPQIYAVSAGGAIRIHRPRRRQSRRSVQAGQGVQSRSIQSKEDAA